MRKSFIAIFLLITILSFAVICIAEEYSTQEELKKIEQDTQDCIDVNYISDYTMAQCVIEGTKKYNIEIEKTVKAAKNYLSQSQYEQFLKTQAQWEEFMKTHDKTNKINFPPYQPYLEAADDTYEYTKDRAMTLNKFIEGAL